MSDWKTYKLGELATIKGGKRLPKGVLLQSTPNSHPYIRIRDLGKTRILELDSTYEYVDDLTQKSIARYIVEKGDILLSIVGTIGLVGIVGESLHLANQTENCVKLINLNKVDRLYLYYYLSSKIGQIEIQKGIVGAVQAKLPIKNIENIEISLPPLAEQKRIADILNAIDDKIELNRRINANLEQQAQALYKSWFVDFEPFGGKMPEDWRVGTLGEIITITSGKHPKNRVSIKTKDVNIPIVGAADIIGYTNEMLYSIPILIIGRVGTHGIVQRFSTKCWPSDNTLVIQTKYYEMCYQLLKQIDYKKLNRGSTQPLITQTDIKGVEVIIPPIEILEEYEKRVSILFHSINNYDIENSSLSALRDTLLPKLMSGEITV
jgi:type I restriction enzyme S subunit